MAANKSGATCGFLVKLGSIGSMGQVPGNCHRGLCRLDSIFFLTGRNNGLDSLWFFSLEKVLGILFVFSLQKVLDSLLIVFASGNALLTWKPQRPYSFLAQFQGKRMARGLRTWAQWSSSHLTLGSWLWNKEGCSKNWLAMTRTSKFSGSLNRIAPRCQTNFGLGWIGATCQFLMCCMGMVPLSQKSTVSRWLASGAF